MRRGLAIAALVASGGCDSILRLDPIKPLPMTVSYRKPLTITNATGTMLLDEPVSIALAADPDLVAHSAGDGSDLAFDDGTMPLAYEIVGYRAGTLDAWVRVPALAPGPTTIYLDYGAATAPGDPTLVWPDPYVGVWHQSGSDSTSKDSTRHGHDLGALSVTPGAAAGIVGGARSFDGAVMEPMCGGDSDGSLEFDDKHSFAYSVWVYVPQTPSTANIAFHKGGSSTSSAGFDMELSALAWHAYLSDGVTSTLPMVEPSINEPLQRWAEILVVVDRGHGQLFAYLDGSLADSASIAGFGSLVGSEPMCLGAESGGNEQFGGLIDEARVVTGVPSNAQILFEHANLAARDSVVAVGAEEPVQR